MKNKDTVEKSRCCGENLVPITSDEGTGYYQCQLCQMDSDPMEKCKNQLEPTKVFRCVDGCDSELRFYGDMGCLAKSYTGNWTFGINAHFNDVIFYCGKHSKEDAEFEFKKCTSTAGEKPCGACHKPHNGQANCGDGVWGAESPSMDFESFDSFFAGLEPKDERKAIYLYEKYIRTLLAEAERVAYERGRIDERKNGNEDTTNSR